MFSKTTWLGFLSSLFIIVMLYFYLLVLVRHELNTQVTNLAYRRTAPIFLMRRG